VPSKGLYLPDPPAEQLLAAKPRKPTNPLVISIQYCVGVMGRVQDIEVLDDGGAPAIAALLVEVVHKWRLKPAIIEGQPVLSCAQHLFVLGFSRRGARRSASEP
jgi:hypothetical protein